MRAFHPFSGIITQPKAGNRLTAKMRGFALYLRGRTSVRIKPKPSGNSQLNVINLLSKMLDTLGNSVLGCLHRKGKPIENERENK